MVYNFSWTYWKKFNCLLRAFTNTRGKIKHVLQNNAKSMISEKAFDAKH